MFLCVVIIWLTGAQPLVVFLGNHSSGKSTFINYVLKRANPDFKDIQKTGVAPLDDGR